MDTRLKIRQINSNLDNIKKSVSDGKSSVASAITAKGVTTAADATYTVMAANIRAISTKPRIRDLGNGYSFNVAGICPNYRELTVDNFVVDCRTGMHDAPQMSSNSSNFKGRFSGFGITKNYNSSNGQFTITNYGSCVSTIKVATGEENRDNFTFSCNVKVVY